MIKKCKYLWWIVAISIALVSIITWLLEKRWNQWFSILEYKKAGVSDHEGRIFPGRRIKIQSILECPFESAWNYSLSSGLMHQVSWPLMRMSIKDEEMPHEWSEGDQIQVILFTLGFIPLGRHEVYINKVDRNSGVIHSMEHGQIIRALDHRIQLQPYGKHLTLYSDEVSVYAGILTGFFAWGVRFFYRYRQTRWQWLARNCS